MVNEFPGASSYTDRHGRQRWRYRHGRRTVALPGDPAATAAYRAAYDAAVAGLPLPMAGVVKHPGAALPRTFAAAWAAHKRTPEWKRLAPVSAQKRAAIAERFLSSPVAPGAPEWRTMPVADLRRRHVKIIMADFADRPHAGKHMLQVLRRMIDAALDEEWIDHDPTARFKWSAETKGHRPWTFDELMAYERRWPIGTTARLAYALALWLGNRRSDVATMTPADIRNEMAHIRQVKTGHEIALPIVPMLDEVLAAHALSGPTVLLTAYGKPFSPKSLTGHMAIWTREAGLPKGCTMHGLRKTLGMFSAQAGATTRQGMSMLGHETVKEFERYSRGANQELMARDGMAKVVQLWKKRTGERNG